MCKKLVSVLLCGLLVLTFFTPAGAGLIQDQSGGKTVSNSSRSR